MIPELPCRKAQRAVMAVEKIRVLVKNFVADRIY